MSQSPIATEQQTPEQNYLDAWQQLAKRIQRGQSFSGRERNCVFLNTRGSQFADVSAATGLDHIDDSRAIAFTDWDQDGDLDLWLANRTGPRIRFLRNDVVNDNHSLVFELIGDPRKNCPRDAIGARVTLVLDSPDDQAESPSQSIVRTLAAGDGYLSQSSKRLFFGVPAGTVPQRVEVRWPGSSDVEIFADLALDQAYRLRQGTGTVEQIEPRTVAPLTPTPLATSLPQETDATRVWRSKQDAVTPFDYENFEGRPNALSNVHRGPLVVTLWASWCGPCIEELNLLTQRADELKQAGAFVLALNVEALEDPESGQAMRQQASEILTNMQFPFAGGMATDAVVKEFDRLRKGALYREDPLPIPVSFLIDARGNLRVIYSGSLDVDQLLEDLQYLDVDEEQQKNRSVPFAGRWGESLFVTNPISIANIYREERQFSDAVEYLQRFVAREQTPADGDSSVNARRQRMRLADVHYLLGRLSLDQQDTQGALDSLKQSLGLNPQHDQALIALAEVMMRAGRADLAEQSLQRVLSRRPRDPRLWTQLGLAQLNSRKLSEAIESFQKALEADPNWLSAANNLAWLWATHPDEPFRRGAQAVELAQQNLERLPERPDFLDTLAAAYAETGDFSQAIEFAESALERAKALGQEENAAQIQQRLELYRQSQPYRQSLNP